MTTPFLKMHGLGNDFLVLDGLDAGERPAPERIAELADRRTGVGFDQLLVIETPRRAGTDAYYRVFNADGGEAEQCGNGARCIALAVAERQGRTEGRLVLDSPAGEVQAELFADGRVSVDMGRPRFAPAAIPFEAPAEAVRYEIEAGGERLEVGAVSMGNPHCVVPVTDVEAAPVASLGPALERHARFPRRANVGFLEIMTRERGRLRVHERGVGETLACGTGACAAMVVGRRWGAFDEQVTLELPGGELVISWRADDQPVWLTGPAALSFRGELE